MTDESPMRLELANKAKECNKDIATADHVSVQIAPDAPRPGQVITWIARMKPEYMKTCAENLRAFGGALGEFDSEGGVPAVHRMLKEEGGEHGWSGAAADAFADRFKLKLLPYVVAGDGNVSQAVERQATSMDKVADKIENLQEKCIGYIDENLKGLYEKYEQALAKEKADDAAQKLGTGLTTTGGVLAALVTGGGAGAAGAMTAVGNAIFAFNEAASSSADNALGNLYESADTEIDKVEGGLEDFVLVSEVSPDFKPLELEGSNDEISDEEWVDG